MLFELDKDTFKTLVLDSKELVLVDFFANWCKSCESLETYLENISEDYYGKIKIFKFNIEQDDEILDTLEIFNLPTLILFDNGKEKGRLEGLISEKKIVDWLAL
ncbi:thioredoxin family protein [Acholeplasma hippikon]|uniref:thioredoxin family protein n=1 Tax=Acholeplasma hippikon TaxID=264636 RepID=UPI00138E10FE|nr:thioredoxin domain-containing protein [Acholeplasma hippikon]